MDSFESVARQKHKSLYDLIWEARKTNKKYIWFAIGAVSFFQLIWKSVIVGSVIGLLYFGVNWTATAKEIVQFVLVFVFASPVVEALLNTKTSLRNISIFISVAGDMNRIRKGEYGSVWKIIATTTFLFFGSLATYSAFVVWMLKRKNPSDLDVSELDVLGTALAKSGFCHDAEFIFVEIERRYDRTIWRKDNEAISCAASYALACKWMISCWPKKKRKLQEKIQMVLRNHPSLPEEITMRLHEALTM